MNSHLNLFDSIVLLIYLLATVCLGCYFIRKNKSPDQFMRAGGNLPGWAVGLSIFGTYVSSISFLGNPGYAFSKNWAGWVFNLSVPLATIFAVKFFIPFYRKKNVISCYQPLEERFGLWARMYTSICFLFTQVARMGVILYLLALPISQLIGCSITSVIFITGIIVVFYSIMGGIEGVIYTDALQAVVLILGALTCLIIIPFQVQGGLGEIFKVAVSHNKFSLGSFDFNLTATTFWVMILFGFTNNLQNLGIDQNYVQRYVTAKSEKTAIRSVWLSASLYIPVSALFFFIGTSLFVLYTKQPQLLPTELAKQVAAGQGDQIFPFFIVNNLHYGMAGILVAAIFAAAMSTLSSNLNSSATLICEDYYKRFFKNTSDKSAMRILRYSTFIFGLIAISAALTMIKAKSALDLNWILAGIFGGGILGLFILSTVSYTIKNSAAVISVLTGIVLIAFLTLSPMSFWPAGWPKSSINSLYTLVIGTSAIIILGFVLTALINFFRKKTH